MFISPTISGFYWTVTWAEIVFLWIKLSKYLSRGGIYLYFYPVFSCISFKFCLIVMYSKANGQYKKLRCKKYSTDSEFFLPSPRWKKKIFFSTLLRVTSLEIV